MRYRIHFLAPLMLALLIFGFHCAPAKSSAAVSVSVGLYYDQLDPYGDWYYAADYGGWVWSPGYVSAGWRPYTVGYWVYSDWGWVWVSEDPWGDWPYHYGRWAFDASYGWVWCPGDVWAPAWVSWRYGSGWVGWAPLPPDVDWSYGIGIRYSSSSLDRRIVSGGWCFVPVNDFANRRVRGRVVSVTRNVALMQQTRNVTRYVDVNSRPVERGLRVDLIERAAGKRIPRYDITERSVRGRGGVQVRGRAITVSKPTRSAVRAANSRLQALPRDRAERGSAVRENENASRRQNDARMRSDRVRQERRSQQIQEQRRRDERSQQIEPRRRDQRTQIQEQPPQVEERRSQQRQEQRWQQAEQQQPRQERPSQQARERRPSQDRRSQQVEEQRPRQERRSQQVEQRRPRQERRSQPAQQQRKKQEQDRDRRGRGNSGT